VAAADIAPGLATDASGLGLRETPHGRHAPDDTNAYFVWHKTDTIGGPSGKYLVNDAGEAVWFVDPGINGTFKQLPDGTTVEKYDAPKAVLMSYIIKGILDRELPWALVLLGVAIAVTLELAGIPSLAFAVGVYLPLSASAPIFVGGLIRKFVDRKKKHELRHSDLDDAQLAAESDKSPGVLASSGFIAGGAIAGILIAVGATSLKNPLAAIEAWAGDHNPFYAGPWSDLLALVPFAVLVGFLYLVAREKLLSGRRP
jgi:hypothetical protein